MKNGTCAVMNLDDAYQAYKNGTPLKEIISEEIRVINSTYRRDLDPFSWVRNYQDVKNRLFIRVSNAERNEQALKDAVHKIVDGIAITYHVLINDGNGEVASAIVNNYLFEKWGIDAETLHNDALKSSENLYPAVARNMAQVLKVDDVELKNDFKKEILLTNTRSLNGASAMFYPGVLNQLTTHAGFEKACIVPLSIHEVLVCPYDGTESARKNALMGMLETCGMDDFLSDMIYTYDRNTDKVSLLSEA